MNQEKIGKFIARKRKEKNLTQEELARKLLVSNKSISRWENGKSMPDVSMFNDLCKTLDITLEELLSGEEKTIGNIETINYIKYQKERYYFKLITIIIISLLILGITFYIVLKKPKLYCSKPLNYYKEITKISDNTTLYSKFEENLYGKFTKEPLKHALMNKETTIEKIVLNAKAQSEFNDGGSVEYITSDGIYIYVCNSLEGNGDNHNIYISDKQDYRICIYDYAKKLDLSCLENKLKGFIDNNLDTVHKINTEIKEITDASVTSYEIGKNRKNTYAIIKTDEEKALEDFKKYFKNINESYKFINIFENYYVFISNGNEVILDELNECIY